MPILTSEEQEIVNFIRTTGFMAAIKNACFSFNREMDQTPWETGTNLPLGGEYKLKDHQPAMIINNLGKVKYTAAYQAPGFSTTIKFGERQFRGKEIERRVTIKSTVCREDNGLYFFVRLFSVDGLFHQAGQDFTFDSRVNSDLYSWILATIDLSGNTSRTKSKMDMEKLPAMITEYWSHPA